MHTHLKRSLALSILSISLPTLAVSEPFKGGRSGDVLNWNESVIQYAGDKVLEVSTGQVVRITGFTELGQLKSIRPFGGEDAQGYDNQKLDVGIETTAWVGRDCDDFGYDYTLVFTPDDPSKPEQRLIVRKVPLAAGSTLAAPWPAGTVCMAED